MNLGGLRKEATAIGGKDKIREEEDHYRYKLRWFLLWFFVFGVLLKVGADYFVPFWNSIFQIHLDSDWLWSSFVMVSIILVSCYDLRKRKSLKLEEKPVSRFFLSLIIIPALAIFFAWSISLTPEISYFLSFIPPDWLEFSKLFPYLLYGGAGLFFMFIMERLENDHVEALWLEEMRRESLLEEAEEKAAEAAEAKTAKKIIYFPGPRDKDGGKEN